MSSRPALMAYHDSTRTKSNSLSKNSQEIVALLDGKVKITTYTNLLDKDFWSTLPNHINFDKETFRPYTRFKPDMKIRYVLVTKLLQKSGMRKNVVIDLIYRGFI